MLSQILLGAAAAVGVANAQSQQMLPGVIATGTMGETNPPEPTLGTVVNQTSMARLVSLNAIDDFCLFGPPEPNSVIGETEDREVAWCVQPRNNARVIPDGTFQGVHFVKTPMYWQIQGYGDFTKMNIQAGDMGGELDPHGATGKGNPVGGNVTTNATGSDVHYEEWMNYISYQTFCLRICINANSTYSAASMCQHQLDVMGCNWVMPGDYTNGTFTECEAEAAYPPGVYPEKGGGFSTFAQRWTGTVPNGKGASTVITIGDTVTPTLPAFTPASSNCKTYSSIGNGIPPAALSSDAIFTYTPGMSFSNLPSSATAAPTTPQVTQITTTDAQGSTVVVSSTVPPEAQPAKTGDKKNAAAPAAPFSGPMLAGAVSLLTVFSALF